MSAAGEARPPAAGPKPPVVLDPAADPGAAALGASGVEASVELSWLTLLHRRVRARAASSPRHQWWVLGALLAGLLSLNITFTVFVVALPRVAGDLHTSISVLTWTSTGPLLAFGLAAPALGKVGDVFGHRRLYFFGLLGAIACTALTAAAPNAGVLVAARTLDGIEGAATGTASMALVLQVFAPEDRVKAMGWWSLVGAGGPVLGVTLGAPVIQFLGWRVLFLGQLGLLALSTAVVLVVLPPRPSGTEAAGGSWRDVDWAGSTMLSLGLTSAMVALNLGPGEGWGSSGVVVSWVASAAALGLFVHRELTAARPLIAPRYFARRNFTMPMVARACTSFAYFGGFFLFPLLMEQVYSVNVTQAGLLSIARPLVFSLSAPVAGYLAARVGERTSVVVGSASVVASMALFATLSSNLSLAVAVAALCLSGLGMGVASPATSSVMANEVDESELGVMSAAQQLAMQVGEVAGIQVLQSIEESGASVVGVHHGPALLAPFHQAFVVGALAAAAGTLGATFIRPSASRRPALEPAGAGAADP